MQCDTFMANKHKHYFSTHILIQH